MPEIKVKKPRRVSTVIGITFIVLQILMYMFDLQYAATAISNAVPGVSPDEVDLNEILFNNISYHWMLILGLCLIFLPRIVDKIRQRSDHHAIKK